MIDRRFHPENARVAHASLGAAARAPERTEGTPMRCRRPVADLCESPGGARDKQVLFGEELQVLESHAGWAFAIHGADGYVGYVAQEALEPVGAAATHRVVARSTHVYGEADMKSPERFSLSFGARLTALHETEGFLALEGGGYVPLQHVAPLSETAADPAAIAELFLGTPYLWGGNSGFGIDCSGLVQAAMWAAGQACPRDSDLQAALGAPVADVAELARGDIVCWRGHVGMMLDASRLIHANAHHMAVAIEPLAQARHRIAEREFGEITALRRVTPARP
ncbi:Gamma-D-glutamyl-L-lysine endopeptidase [Pseudoruegeria aquimaris]|uniref:Gamma-D-glutamyl-L-lysine endopeptidase n=1 Tax=Pseudoruegeria aquimaris TaxID=393663 RepID=A0A1Y5RZ15_9RHOB|nr:NlpC/P60 family protein [Pseudoruegeria aquimaris]SLN28531.1 Gamma-D-glutamyl-L-lysine endopeptidase [Pseudoruegeria aquimaris]